MKTVVITCPIRPEPDRFPPIGALSVMSWARRGGFPDISLYDIDAFRPTYEETIEHLRAEKPDVLAVSAVVSTAYVFVRDLTRDIKKVLPDCTIILGGNLAASAEILLRKTGVDFCAIGEGEVTFLNFLKRLQTTRRKGDFHDVPGLAFLADDGALINTGFEKALPGDKIYDIDWNDFDRFSSPPLYIYPAFDDANSMVWAQAAVDPRLYDPRRRNKKVATLSVGKGCVARCTFCHRFDKGIVHIPPALVMKRLQELVDRYDVGFVDMHIESFGSDKRWLTEFCRLLEPFDVLWRVTGVRCRSVNPEIIDMMKRSGCVALTYGFESGSQRMLDVMEKKTPVQANYDAARWTLEAGLYTVAQFVLGMPGETNDTIRESVDFARFVYTTVPWLKPSDVSINYAQALPGTPLYELGRHVRKIGQSIDDEERYLIDISGANANETASTINFTDAPLIDWISWRGRLVAGINWAYLRRYGLDRFIRVLNGEDSFPDKGGQCWIPMTRGTPLSNAEVRRLKIRYLLTGIPRLLIYSNGVTSALAGLRQVLLNERSNRETFTTRDAWSYAGKLLLEWVRWHWRDWRREKTDTIHESLRRTVKDKFGPLAADNPGMRALREGR
jgi:anaerobic magnesium-protoporphyrin IX monomethyl ester cyclase